MSPSVFITTRKTDSGARYVVRFRRGGRYTKLEHAGSFKTQRDAKARQAFIAHELAAGRDPAVALRALTQPVEAISLDEWFTRFSDSRVDVGPKTKALYRNARATLGKLADRIPAELVAADFQEWVARNSKLAPKTLRHYIGTIRQVIDFAGVEPNPARSPRVKLPRKVTEEVSPPSGTEWAAIQRFLAPRLLLAARLMEAEALRVTECLTLTYGDVDFANSRIRISRARTKGGTAGQRWLDVPVPLMDELDLLLPVEDRSAGRFVFGFTPDQMRYGITRACRHAQIAHYHPHDLRHRRISLWFAHGFDPPTVALWSGHSHSSMSLDVYAHVVIDARSDEWRGFWIDVYTRERRERVQA